MAKILVVDDEELILEILQVHLDFYDHQVTCASSGQEAQKLFEQGHFDLIISDIKMPNGDGVEFLKSVRETERGRLTPFIFITGFSEYAPRDCFALGADSLFMKPFALDEMTSAIDRHLTPWKERFLSQEKSMSEKLTELSLPFKDMNGMIAAGARFARGGLSIVSDVPVPQGKLVRLQLSEPKLWLEGIVQWRSEERVGIELLALSPELKAWHLKSVKHEQSEPLCSIPL